MVSISAAARCSRRRDSSPFSEMQARCRSSASMTSSIPIFCAATVFTTGGRQRPGSVRSPSEIMWRRSLTVGLVDDEDVTDLEDAGLGGLDAVAHAGGEEHDRRVGQARDLDLGLADA